MAVFHASFLVLIHVWRGGVATFFVDRIFLKVSNSGHVNIILGYASVEAVKSLRALYIVQCTTAGFIREGGTKRAKTKCRKCALFLKDS